MRKIFLLLLSVTLLASCKKDDEYQTKSSSYPKLNGEYVHHYYYSDSHGINENSEYISYEFNKTNVCKYYSCVWGYSTNSGWINPAKDGLSQDLEWRISNNNFSRRSLFNYGQKTPKEYWYLDSGKTLSFEFISNDSIMIDSELFIKK